MFLKISLNSQENTCARVSFLIKLQAEAYNFFQKKTLAETFSCTFCLIFRSTFSTEHLRVTASMGKKWEASTIIESKRHLWFQIGVTLWYFLQNYTRQFVNSFLFKSLILNVGCLILSAFMIEITKNFYCYSRFF